jgi:hypothetical protein
MIIMVKNNYFGVLAKEGKDFVIYTYCSEINLSKELKDLWQGGVQVHIRIESNARKLLDESKCELYYDRDKNKQYKLHINDVDIEQILQKSIGKQLDITITHEIGDKVYEADNVHTS